MVSGHRRAAWRGVRAKLFFFRRTCARSALSFSLQVDPPVLSTSRIRLSLSFFLAPIFPLRLLHSTTMHQASSFVRSSVPCNHINVRASASRHRHSLAHASARILASWGRESPPLPTRLTLLTRLTRSLVRFKSLPLAAPFLFDLPLLDRSSSCSPAPQYCKQSAKRTFARMQTVHRPPVTAFYISPW